MERRHPLVANADEVPATEGPVVGTYRSTMVPLGRATGGKKLGCSFYEVPAGAAAFPYHWHSANEEAIIVLSGTGTIRLGDAEVQLRAGDYVAMPTGPQHSHQVRNTGTEPLRYYCVSTKLDPEVVGYPDSRKLGVAYYGADGNITRSLFFEEETRGYFDRDPGAAPKP